MAADQATPPVPRERDRKGPAALVTGVLIAVVGFALPSACCWAPALIMSLGLGTIIGALHNAQAYLIAAGLALAAVGAVWQLRRRRPDACGCEPRSG